MQEVGEAAVGGGASIQKMGVQFFLQLSRDYNNYPFSQLMASHSEVYKDIQILLQNQFTSVYLLIKFILETKYCIHQIIH